MLPTLGVSTFTTTPGTPIVSGSFTPTAGDLLVFFAILSDVFDPLPRVVSSVAGMGFDFIGRCPYRTSLDSVYCWVGTRPATPAAQTFSISTTAAVSGAGQVVVACKNGGPRYGAGAVRQRSLLAVNGSGGGTPFAQFPVATLSDSALVACVGNNTNPATITPPAGWTELTDSGYATPTTGGEVAMRASGGTSTVYNFAASGSTFACLGVELTGAAVQADDAAALEAGWGAAR